jgi:hypothetical protein
MSDNNPMFAPIFTQHGNLLPLPVGEEMPHFSPDLDRGGSFSAPNLDVNTFENPKISQKVNAPDRLDLFAGENPLHNSSDRPPFKVIGKHELLTKGQNFFSDGKIDLPFEGKKPDELLGDTNKQIPTIDFDRNVPISEANKQQLPTSDTHPQLLPLNPIKSNNALTSFQNQK